MPSQYQRILQRARELESENVRLLADLVRTPSFSGKEKDVILLIKKEMEAAGFDAVRIDGLGNVIGRLGNGPRQIVFDAHIDTVYPGETSLWSTGPFQPVVSGGEIRGRGTVDQKGGMAAMITAGRIIKELDLAGEFTVLFTGTVMEEDCEGLCWEYLLQEEGLRPELVIITEPTNLGLYRGHRGRTEIQVNLPGRSCHGSAPERGDNAVYKAARLALEIEKLNRRLADHPFLGPGTIAVTRITSSSPSLCAVPDAASLHLDRRLTLGETEESALAGIREAAVRAGCPEATAEILEYRETSWQGLVRPMKKYFPTWFLEESSPWVELAARAHEQLYGHRPVSGKWTFSTNGVSIAGLHGIPCLGFGPGNEVFAHAPDERCPVEHLTIAAAFYAGLLRQLNQVASAGNLDGNQAPLSGTARPERRHD